MTDILGVVVIIVLYFAFAVAISIMLRDMFAGKEKGK